MHKRMMHPPAAARKRRHAELAMSQTASVARKRRRAAPGPVRSGRTGTIGRAASGRIGPHRGGPGPSRPRGPTNLTTRASPAGRPHI